MKMNLRGRAAAVGVLVTLSLASASAQRMPITRNVTVTIKPDRNADFVAAVKEYNAAYSKIAGVRGRVQYQSLTGQNRYRLVLGYPDWAAMDAASKTAGNVDLA